MSDADILFLYNNGYSIDKIAKRYKAYEKRVFNKTITLFYARQIVDFIIYTYNKSIYNK